MKNRLLERIHPTELQEARAVAEAKPLPTRKPFRAAYTGVAADVLPWLRAADTSWSALGMRRPVAPTAPRPIALTDWSARIADDWAHVESNLDNLAESLIREADRIAAADQYGTHVATAPLLSELTELTAVQLPAWRKALASAAADELAWIDAEMAVSL